MPQKFLQIVKTRSNSEEENRWFFSEPAIFETYSNFAFKKQKKTRRKFDNTKQSTNTNMFFHFYHINLFFSKKHLCIMWNWQQYWKIVRMIKIRIIHNIRMLITNMVSIISTKKFHLKENSFIARLLFCTVFIALIRDLCTVF